MDKLNIDIPYKVCDNIQVKTREDIIILTNIYTAGYVELPTTIYSWLTANAPKKMDDCEIFFSRYSILDMLVTNKFIEPDLSKIEIGKTSVYVPKKTLLAPNATFNIDEVKKNDNMEDYEYLCERSALRMALIGYGVNEPLFWMRCGLYIYDGGFFNDGNFFTSFSRPMLDTKTLPLLGKDTYSLDWGVIDTHLEKGYPALVSVDVYYMPYKHKTYYQKRHGAHSILLLGKNDTSYTVLDWYSPDYFYGEVSIDDLTLARTSKNEKDQISVFSGFSINSQYCLLNVDKIPYFVDTHKCIRDTLHLSAKYLLDKDGAIAFFEKAIHTPPKWLNEPGHIGYQNALESFFFLDIELKMLVQYFEKMHSFERYLCFQPKELCASAQEIKKLVETLRTKIIFAYRRKKIIGFDVWQSQIGAIKMELEKYCEKVLLTLKNLK